MRWDRQLQTEIEATALRSRLAAIALAGTVALLGGADLPVLAVLIATYLAVAVGVRFLIPAVAWPALPVAAVVVDVAFVSALVALPFADAPFWTLYVFAIGIGGLRWGGRGAAGATALALLGYDAALATRADARALELWPLQAVIAMGLVVAELVWTRQREAAERVALRQHAVAARALAAAGSSDALLAALTLQLLQVPGVQGALVWSAGARGARVAHVRGNVRDAVRERRPAPAELPPRGTPVALDTLVHGSGPGLVVRVADTPPIAVGVTFDAASWSLARSAALVCDIVADATALLANALEREDNAARLRALDSFADSAVGLAGERTEPGVIAEIVTRAAQIAGRAAIVRRADGELVAGDGKPAPLAALARDGKPLTVLAGGDEWVDRALLDLSASSAVVADIGSGLALVAFGGSRELTDHDVAAIERLSRLARPALTTVRERDALDREMGELRGKLETRDDALAVAAHEIRAPLTSVHGYAQLMARNLEAVQQQVAQLERLISDLLRPGRAAGGASEPLALDEEVRAAVGRLRVRRGVEVLVARTGAAPAVLADRLRIAQVLDNLLENAAKFAPAGTPIRVAVSASYDEVRVDVTDEGPGVAEEERARIFERGYRSPRLSATPGAGLGLAISRELIETLGGRIGVESEGPARGSTFWFALPRAGSPAERREARGLGAA